MKVMPNRQLRRTVESGSWSSDTTRQIKSRVPWPVNGYPIDIVGIPDQIVVPAKNARSIPRILPLLA